MNNFLSEYLTNDCALIPCKNKIPLIKNWRQAEFDDFDNPSYQSFGWVLTQSDLVIDVDLRNDGQKSYDRLCADLNLSFTKTVLTPSGGYHIYLKKSPFQETIKQLEQYPGIDFLSNGAYVIIAGSQTDDGQYTFAEDLLGFYTQDCPFNLSHLLFKSKPVPYYNPDLGDFAGLLKPEISEDELLAILAKLDHNMPNDQWVKVGMALKRWDNERGLVLWENWSKGGHTYKEGETAKRWTSFTSHNNPVTIGTLKYFEKVSDFDNQTQHFTAIKTFIENATIKDLKFELEKKLKDLPLTSLETETLSKLVQKRFKDLTGVTISIKEIRKFVYQEDNQEIIERPAWCEDWVYVNSHNAFAHLGTLTLYKTELFNLANGKYIPTNSMGYKTSAIKFVSDNSFIDSVESLVYFPQNQNKIVTFNHKRYLNTYSPENVPKTAATYSKSGLETIERIKNHTVMICNTKENARILLQFLAHNVQFPGKKILWAPIIQSIQGVGKSFYNHLLELVLGSKNVGVVSPVQAMSDFNGWASGVCVNILEELRIRGHNRHEIANAIKPLITDSSIQINEKNVKHYKTLNTTNYICFTNYRDALPITKDDRRWWPICCQLESLEDIEKVTGISSVEYFPQLFDSLNMHYTEVRKWLLEYTLTDEFLSLKQAPMSDYKTLMIATEDADIEYKQEFAELIDKGGQYYNKECISSADLFDIARFEIEDLGSLKPRAKNQLLKSLGYFQLPKPFYLDNKTRRIWAKRLMTIEEVKESLKIE